MKTHSIVSETLASSSDVPQEEQLTLNKANRTVAHRIQEIRSRAQLKETSNTPPMANVSDMAAALTKKTTGLKPKPLLQT